MFEADKGPPNMMFNSFQNLKLCSSAYLFGNHFCEIFFLVEEKKQMPPEISEAIRSEVADIR